MLLLVGACGLGSSDAVEPELTPTTFVEMESARIDGELQAAIDEGSAVGPDYNSDPPTSGPHADDYADCGVYRVEIPDIYQVHSLKRGSVMVQYPPTIQASDREALEGIARELGSDVIVAPRSGLTGTVVLTAWTRMVTLSSVDLDVIRSFHEQFAQRAPDNAECPLTVTLAE
jgi:hypothetical protein